MHNFFLLNNKHFNKIFNVGTIKISKFLLLSKINRIFKKNVIPLITYDDIKKDEDWEAKIDNILIEEINKMKIGGGLGSWRGYGTFVESKLYENTVKAVLFKIGKLEKCI